jgi:predicted  nucleic acid-binding Zn-ribbon protein
MAKEGTPSDATIQPQQDVNRIREIIFGAQMRAYEQRFQAQQRDLERLQQQLDQLAEQGEQRDSNQTNKTHDLRNEMRQANDTLREELRAIAQALTNDKVDRVALAEMFVQLASHLKDGGSLGELLQGLK